VNKKLLFLFLLFFSTYCFCLGQKEIDLFNAVNQNNLPKIKELIAQKADVNARTREGLTPLHYAEDIHIVDFLIKAGADINATTNDKTTPLFSALFTENRKKAALLLQAGAAVNTIVKAGGQDYTPLRWAVEVHDYPLVKLMLKKGAEIPSYLQELLQGIGNVEIARLLQLVQDYKILHAKDSNQLNLKDKKGLTRMHQAVIDNDLVKIDALLIAGADINKQDISGNTPLDLAFKKNKENIIKRLMSNGAQANTYRAMINLSNALQNLLVAFKNLHIEIKDILLYD
jgi:ankyrin repeat protein